MGGGRISPSNVGLRLNYGLLGIDVDAYDAKTGGQTLKEAEIVGVRYPLRIARPPG